MEDNYTNINPNYDPDENKGISNDSSHENNSYENSRYPEATPHTANRESNYNPYTYNPYTNNPYAGRNPAGPDPQGPDPYNRSIRTGSKKPRKKSGKKGFGATLGKTAAIALVFGIIFGGTFSAVNAIGNRFAGSAAEDARTKDNDEVKEETTLKEEKTEEASTQTPEESKKDNQVKVPVTGLTDVSDIAEDVMPSIVAITNTATITRQTFWGYTTSYPAESCGSGIILDKDDEYYYIATNNHVVADAETLSVRFCDEAVVDAETRGVYPSGDLAVVMVKIDDVPEETQEAIDLIDIGDSTVLRVGEPTIAIGNALGYGQSVTTGIVSALGRSVTTSDQSTRTTYTHDNLIQTDAAINPGNSGGALLNKYGQLIGINSVKYSSTDVEGIGYAIPMEDAMPIIQSLIENGKYADTQTAYLGISGADVTPDIAQTYKMPEGVYVSGVYAGSGADQAGLGNGDIITHVGDTEVKSMDELKSALSKYTAGDTAEFTIYRLEDNSYKEMKMEITLISAADMESYSNQ